MYLKKIKLTNFRKFLNENNEVEFTDSQGIKRDDSGNINIASTTTLLVGKNNSGKTTIIEALDILTNEKVHFSFDDFNYGFIKELINKYKEGNYDAIPYLEFEFTIGLDKSKEDYIVNIAPFMSISHTATEIHFWIRYELKEAEVFRSAVKALINPENYNEEEYPLYFYKLQKLVNSSSFQLLYLNENDAVIKDFKLTNLIDFFKIQANKITTDDCLSKSFNKIILARNKSENPYDTTSTLESIEKINSDLERDFNKNHTEGINKTLTKIVDEGISVKLRSDLTFEKIINNIAKYEYVENNNFVPENQFGLGYTNLMVIISKLVEYMEQYPDSSFNSKINIIAIEEPETYMHPQLQELFIKHINDAISILLQQHDKNLNTQLVLSTHSSHIINSKIHSGGTFNSINYITHDGANTKVVPMNDKRVAKDGNTENDDFRFIKKHFTLNASDLFFADAAILIEGAAENVLLPYFISQNERLSRKFITVLSINGAHALVYNNLLKLLNIPVLIITDLDIERDKVEQESFSQIDTLEHRKTTNKTIAYYNSGNYELNNDIEYITDENIKVVFQQKENGFYPTSFEEALVLSNYNSNLLNEVLKSIKPRKYSEIVGEDEKKEYNKTNSFKWQSVLSNSKSNLANELLYRLITSEETIVLPKYIQDGLDYIQMNTERG